MQKNKISLYDMPREIMLVIEHPSGVLYSNQAGGVVCAQPEIEGVLAPIDLGPENVERIMRLDYGAGSGLEVELADAIDEVLSSESGARYLRVDRARLEESMEAWVFVVASTPTDTVLQLEGPYWGAAFGFGDAKGVLTWHNSD